MASREWLGERRAAIIIISVATLLALLGTTLGALWLLALLSPHPLLLNPRFHPELQAFGFLNLFIMAVGFMLIPRFRNKRFGRAWLILLCAGLVALGNILWLLQPGQWGTLLVLAGSAIFSLRLLAVLGLPQGHLAPGDAFIGSALVLLPLALALRLLWELGLSPLPGLFSQEGYLELVLLGYVGSMIYGVLIRTVHFRMARLRSRALAYAALPLHLLGLGLSFYRGALFQGLGTLSFALAVLCLARSTGFGEVDLSSPLVVRMNERDRVRYGYYVRVTRLALAWLLASLAFRALYYVSPSSLAFRDAYVHGLAVGFIAHVIMAYAPILLPGLLNRRMLYRGLTLIPAYLVSLGNGWRIAGFVSLHHFGVDLLGWVSWALLFLGMLYSLYMVHALRA